MALGLGKIRGRHIVPREIGREHLEYPTADVTFAYLGAIDKLNYNMQSFDVSPRGEIAYLDNRVWTDKAVEAWISGVNVYMAGRVVDQNNGYKIVSHNPSQLNRENEMFKWVNAVWTNLAIEAISLSEDSQYLYWAQCKGTELTSQRPTGTTRLSVNDTAFSEGLYGLGNIGYEANNLFPARSWLREAHTPPPRTIACFECPVIGSGTRDDAFRMDIPEDIVKHDKLGNINRLALSYSNVIKSGKDGKPVDYRAIVRVFDQPDRQPHLYEIPKCLTSLKAMKGVKKLDKDKAKKEALKLDDKLKIEDLAEW